MDLVVGSRECVSQAWSQMRFTGARSDSQAGDVNPVAPVNLHTFPAGVGGRRLGETGSETSWQMTPSSYEQLVVGLL